MIKVDMDNMKFEMEGTRNEVVTETSFALASICYAESDGEEFDMLLAEAIVYAAVIATKKFLKEIAGKDIDLERIGLKLINKEK